MEYGLIIALGLAAYALGSIPTAVWVGKCFFNKDIREHGSKNAGFTNALRVFGPKAGIPVLLIDVFKGIAAVYLAQFLNLSPASSASQLIPIIYGLLAIIGHLLPLFAGFRGGKGVATGLGIVIAICPLGALIALGVYLITIFIFRMMSLGSMMASISFPFSVLAFQGTKNPFLLGFSILIPLLILFTHRKNIQRIRKGKEKKMWFIKKK